MDKNIAVIGCGYWGENLVRNFAELGALHTICDSNIEALDRLEAFYPGINREESLESVLASKEIKGIVISSPAALHYSMAKQALLAGKDVFVEKPLAFKVEEARELVQLATNKGKILMVGHLLEYHPAVTKLKNLVDQGELGKIEYIYSNRLNLGRFRTEENILWSFAPHDISVILFLLDSEMPQEISAHAGYYLRPHIADITVTTMSFASGVRVHIFVSWLHPYKEQKLVVIGDRKMVVFDDTNPKEKLCLYSHQMEWREGKPVAHQKKPEVIQTSLEEPLRIECQDFLECIETRRKPKVDGNKGLKVVEILSSCQKSLEENGKVIAVSQKEEKFFVHKTSLIQESCEIGEGTKIWHFSHLMPNVTIGKDCVIGQNVFIGKRVKIGDNVKIENNVSVFEGVTLEDDVFCGPSCVFTNVISPRSHISRKREFRSTLVKKGATIGASATIICGNTIGSYAFVGAGSIVTKDVDDYALVYGTPAKIQGWVCQCGTKLDFTATKGKCRICGEEYERQESEGKIIVRKLNK